MDTYPEFHEHFLVWLRRGGKKKYPNNPTEWGIKVREVKLYDCVMPAQWREPFLKDMAYFEGGGNMWQGRKLRDVLGMAIKMFKLPFKEIKMPAQGSTREDVDPLTGFWAEVLPLVEMPDDYDGNLEML